MGFLSKALSRKESDEDVLEDAAALAAEEALVELDEPTPKDDAAGAERPEPDEDSDPAEEVDPLADVGLDDDDLDDDLDDDGGLDLMVIFEEEVAEVDANVKKLGDAVEDADLRELMEDMREVAELWRDRVA